METTIIACIYCGTKNRVRSYKPSLCRPKCGKCHYPLQSDTVVIRDANDADGRRYLGASLNGSGDLVIVGHDMGPGVSEWFGGGINEYEWSYTVRNKDFPLLIRALGGEEGDNILDVIVERCTGESAVNFEEVISENKIMQQDFWNWHSSY